MEAVVDGGLRPTLARLAAGHRLSAQEAQHAFQLVVGGLATPAQIGGLLMGLRARGETATELLGAARALRSCMKRNAALEAAAVGAIDVCGTGGDQAGTLNVSTAVTFVVAGAGVRVAKHGNRAASSRSGGADVLAELGVRLEPPEERLADILTDAGCVFLFAQRHHAGLRHAAAVRAELGARTLFNLLGPLANPAGVTRQLTGVFDRNWLRPMAEAQAALGVVSSWVVHGSGLDELTLAAPSEVVAQQNGTLRAFSVDAAMLGLAPAPVTAIAGGDPAHNAERLLTLLEGRERAGDISDRAYRDTVLLNSAAALVVAGRADDLRTALALATRSLQDGAALTALGRLRAASEIDHA